MLCVSLLFIYMYLVYEIFQNENLVGSKFKHLYVKYRTMVHQKQTLRKGDPNKRKFNLLKLSQMIKKLKSWQSIFTD